MTKFRIVEVTVTPPQGEPPLLPGPSFNPQWLTAAGNTIAQYWLDMSGGREVVQWFVHPPVQLPLQQAEKDKLSQSELIQAVKEAAAAAGLPFDNDEHVVVMMNDPSSGFGVTPTDEPIVAAKDLDPALLMHEMGHAFQHLAGHHGGHASSPTSFSEFEYNDPTCVMGFEPGPGGGRWAFKDSQFDLLGAGGTIDTLHSDVGPGMCPPMTARCGWLDESNPAAVLDVTGSLPGARALSPWAGAPPPGYAGPRPSVLTVDGHAPGGDRVYLSLRSPRTSWDRAFPKLGADPEGAMVVAQERTASGSTLILGKCAAERDQWMRLGRATLRVEVQESGPDGVVVEVIEDPWRNWTPQNSPELTRASRVAAVSRLAMIDRIVVGADRALHWNRFYSGMWEENWAVIDSPPLATSAAVAMATTSPEAMDLFVIAQDGLIHRRRFAGSGWAPNWEPVAIGGLNDESGLAACSTGEHRVELLCTDESGRVLHQTLEDGRSSDWKELPPLNRARAVAVQRLDGHTVQVHAVSEGPDDGRLWSIIGTDGQWQHWISHGVVAMPVRAGIAATSRPGGESMLVAASAPMRAESFINGAWHKPPELVKGLQLGEFSSLAIVARDHTSVDVIAVGDDGRLYAVTRSLNPDQSLADRQVRRTYPAAFLSPSSRFVSCRDDSALWPEPAVLADVYQLQEAERFVVHELEVPPAKKGRQSLVAIQTSTGEFIRAVNGGGSFLVGDRREVGPHEQFTMIETGGDGVLLKSLTGHLWSAPSHGRLVTCTGLSAGDWESFRLLKL